MRQRFPFGKKPILILNQIELASKGIIAGERTYTPVRITVYERGIVFDFKYGAVNEDIKLQLTPESLSVPIETDSRLLPITIYNHDFFWDRKDCTFRWVPREPALEHSDINPWITYWDNGELRLHKDYAEHNLSTVALDYAFEKTTDYYAWNTDDFSHMPVIYEIPGAFAAFLYQVDCCLCPHYIPLCNTISTYTQSYCDTAPEDADVRYKEYKARCERKLWTPETE